MKAHVYMLRAQLVPPGKATDNAKGTFRSFLSRSANPVIALYARLGKRK